MFTGIVEALGTVRGLTRPRSGALRLAVDTGKLPLRGVHKGSSVAVNGTCLSVVGLGRRRLGFQVVRETLRRTTLGTLKPGERVNLERPLIWRGRVEGHFVSGHVDGRGRVARVEDKNGQRSFLIRYPARMRRYLVPKGSIAVDGVSLTLGRVDGRAFWVHIIPHTLRNTLFGKYRVGSAVNLEADLAAKLRARGRKG